METIRVLQLGAADFSETMRVSPCADWHYEPDFSGLPDRDFDVVILDREITAEEFDFLMGHMRAYCLFVPDSLPVRQGRALHRLYRRKMGRRVSERDLAILLEEYLPDYFSGSYGEKFHPDNLAISQGFQGKIVWYGYQGVVLEGDYGENMTQIAFWRNNIPMYEGQSLEFWLEYEKDESVEILLKLTQFAPTVSGEIRNEWIFSERELDKIVRIERIARQGYVFVSLHAKGKGRLRITALHDRYSRRGKGNFLPGGRRVVASDREEVFYYFDSGNLRPPLNVYFSGYKTQEGFEGYRMMRRLGQPFLLITESRLEGGGFYMGSEEYEKLIEQIIRRHMRALHLDSSQVILSGLSMGTFGALYYGCRIRPHTILIGKPLASIGDVAANERLVRPGGFPTSLDVLQKMCGGMDDDAVRRLNDRFWDAFDRTDWSGTQFAVSYMIEDDYDRTAYGMLQSHLKDAGARIYGKGLHGRHNDDTAGIVNWFVSQYKKIIEQEFGRMR